MYTLKIIELCQLYLSTGERKIRDENICIRSGFPIWDLSRRDTVQISSFLFVSKGHAKMVVIPGF